MLVVVGGRLQVAFVVIASVLAWVTPAGAASWSPPVTLWTATDPSVSSDVPIVAIDDAGYGVVLVPEQGTGTSYLHAFERVPGGTWQESPRALFDGPAFGAAVAVDQAGEALAVWAFGPPTATTIESATWSSATARWSPTQTVATSPGAQAQYFSASANASGQIVVTWESQVDGVVSVYGMVGSTGGGFSPAVRVATLRPGDQAGAFATAIGPAGDAAIQWSDIDGGSGGSNVEVAVQPAGGSFAVDAAMPVTDLHLPFSAGGGQIAVDAAGDVLSTFNTQDPDMWLASSYRPAGGAFGPPQRVASRNDNANGQDIAVAFDGAGNATIAWVVLVLTGDLLHPPAVLESAARPPGASAVWGQAVQLTDPIAGIEWVRLAETADGSAILAPEAIGANADADLIFTRSAGGSFVADGDPGGCIESFVAMAPDGDAALGCWSIADRSEQLLVRDVHGPPLARLQTPAVAVVGAPASFAVTVPGWAQLAGGQPSWSFGDGTSGTGAAVHHTYAKAGSFTIAVTATDADGSAPARILGHITVLPRGSILVGLGSARISGKRLTVHGTASGRGTITLTLRRRARRDALTVVHLAVRGGGWTRSLQLPARLPRGTYDIVASGAKVRGSKTSFRLD
jgi:PKD domain